MAITPYLWPEVKGPSVAFNPLSGDILQFDDPAISAAEVVTSESNGDVLLTYDGETVTLLGVSLYALTSTDVDFADSALIIGDDTTAKTDDSLGNGVTGGAGNNVLAGWVQGANRVIGANTCFTCTQGAAMLVDTDTTVTT